MTRSIGGASPHRPDASISPKSPVRRKQQPKFDFDFGTLPLHAPDILAKNTICVRDPNRILLLKEADRRKDFQTLVNRYIKQLLHGCQEPSCSTPTCFTCRRRATNAPVRKYTDLSARTLAVYFASQDDPEKDLCPHDHVSFEGKPNTERKMLEKLGRKFREQDDTINDAVESGTTAKPPAKPAISPSTKVSVSPLARDIPSDTEARTEGSTTPENGLIPPHTSDVVSNGTEGSKKREKKSTTTDPKSLTQNLFDTRAFKILSWLPLPSLYAIANSSPEAVVDTQTVDQMDFSYQTSQDRTSSPVGNSGALDLENGSQPSGRVSLAWATVNNHNSTSPSTVSAPSTSSFESPAPREPSSCQSRDKTPKPRNTSSIAKHMLLFPDGSSQDFHLQSQTLSHMTYDSVMALIGVMTEAGFYSLKNCTVRSFGKEPDAELANGSFDARYRGSKTFVRQSIYYALGHAEGLIRSFKRASSAVSAQDRKSVQDIDVENLDYAFRSLLTCDRSLVLNSLWQALEGVFIPPPEITPPRSPRLKAALNSVLSVSHPKAFSTATAQSMSSRPLHMGDGEAGHVVVLCLHALAAAVPRDSSPEAWHAVRQLWAQGQVLPAQNLLPASGPLLRQMLRCIDTIEDDSAIRLMNRLVRAVHARGCFAEVLKARNDEDTGLNTTKKSQAGVVAFIQQHLIQHHMGNNSVHQHGPNSEPPNTDWSLPTITIDWIRSVMLKEWDGKGEVKRSGVVGSAVEMLSHLYEIHDQIGLSPEAFQTPFLSDRLDPIEMPIEWLTSTPSSKTVHLLSYPFLFPPAALVGYFRALNHSNMTKAFDTSLTSARLVVQMVFADPFADDSERRVFNRLKLAVDLFLFLKIRRSHVLEDALNQLWRREKRELMRPLKVQMGADEGEEGLDIGGVQQEFFRAAVSEASNPDYGVFITDSSTQISWFQISSFEPLYKFELIGLLVSLAVYNGNTVPLNFPKALYRKLLGLPVNEIQHVRDGWPDKAKGFTELLSWDGEDDVGDVFTFSYEFSFDFWDKQVNVDMEKHSRDDDWMPLQKTTGGNRTQSRRPNSSGLASSAIKVHGTNKKPKSTGLAKATKWKGKGKLTADMIDKANNHVPSYERHTDWATLPAETGNGHDWATGPEYSLPNGEARTGQASVGDVKPLQHSQPQLTNGTSNDEEEANLVTNENREKFVKDYIFWLTDKSIRPQYEAFARGFFVCLDRNALSIFNAEALQTMVEGLPDIDMDGLERVARYEEPYDSTHQTIRDFWVIVKEYPMKRKRQLLEFVTASDRVPANGVGSITFIIMRAGPDSERLPSSTTCFGRLLLPEYSSREKLQNKLDAALEHTKGFGNM